MKKILLLAALMVMSQTLVFAQKERSVKEADVPVRYVKDFQNQNKNATDVSWTMTLDSTHYMATFTNEDGDKQAMRFSARGTETRYYINPEYYPHAITSLYILNLKGKMTYEVNIARKTGFLFWRKETECKHLRFEADCKMIEIIDEE